jgi:ribosome-associated protein
VLKDQNLKSKKLANMVVHSLEELKGISISCIDVKKLTQITDYMVIVTGTSSTHLKALSDAVVKDAKSAGVKVIGVEGRLQAEWVLVDLDVVIVHIMLAPVRALYALEDLWGFESETESETETQK